MSLSFVKNRKVLVAMSGGVDSSVTAALLQEAGAQVVGCFMRLGSDDSIEAADGYDNLFDGACDPTRQPKANRQGCCSVNDAADARLVAAHLDVPFYVMNFKRDFGRVINYFVDEYNAGRTPNPCVRCNDWLKFGKLHDYAKSVDCDFVASGHYARVDRSGPSPRLVRGVDAGKDQSYVLFGSRPHQIEHMILPIGDFQKSQVRDMAEQRGLPVFNKPDSQEICFVPDNDYARLVERRTDGGLEPGEIQDTQGNTVGEHRGHQTLTIGQRRGIGVALGYPIYVVDKNAQTNTVTIGSKQDLMADRLTASQTNWFIDPPTEPTRCMAQVRYNSPATPATVQASHDGEQLSVTFDQPVEAVTPGQAVVCYTPDDHTVIGGGWIDHAQRHDA